MSAAGFWVQLLRTTEVQVGHGLPWVSLLVVLLPYYPCARVAADQSGTSTEHTVVIYTEITVFNLSISVFNAKIRSKLAMWLQVHRNTYWKVMVCTYSSSVSTTGKIYNLKYKFIT